MLDRATVETLLEEAALHFYHDIGDLMGVAQGEDSGKQLGALMAGLAERRVYEWFLDRLQKGLGVELDLEREDEAIEDPPLRPSADQYVQ